MRSSLESAAGSLLGGDLKGQVTRAVVSEDLPRRLSVRVSYEGFQGATLRGELLTRDRKRQSGVAMAEPATISESAGELELTFEAQPDARPSTSSLLKLSITAPNRRTASYSREFQLGKEWLAAEMSGANFSVTITPKPVGRTAELGASPTVVVPTGTVSSPPAPPSPASGANANLLQRTAMQALPAKAPPATTGTPTTRTRSLLIGGRPAAGEVRKESVVSTSRLAISGWASNVGLTPADVSRGARGPAALPLRPFVDVRAEDIGLDLTRVMNVFPEIYQDQEPSSGIFYCLPNGYALKWDEVEGYGFKTIYSAAAEGQVMMAARLDGGIGSRDLELASKLVQGYAQSRGMVFRELRALPIDTLAISISDDLGRYSIPPDRVSVQGHSDIMGQIDVSWTTDERTKNFVHEALIENVGIHGSVLYAPTGNGLGIREVPIRMLLADYATFGPMRWDRTGWKNPTPYPITLRYLHALRVPGTGPAVVNSWGLGGTRVPPGGQVRWNAVGIPFWVDTQAQKMWIDYTVDQSCKSCGLEAIAALSGGGSAAASTQITFSALNPLAESGAHDILVEVRSRYLDPRGEKLQTRTLVVDHDEKDYMLGPFFLDERAATGTQPILEFRLTLTMQNGQPFAGNAVWIPWKTLRVPIARSQLDQSVGALPSR